MFICLLAGAASAGISVSGNITDVTGSEPSDVSQGQAEAANMIIFEEQKDVTDGFVMNYYAVAGQTVSANTTNKTKKTGTAVSSYFIHFDPIDNTASVKTVIATITFDPGEYVLGVIYKFQNRGLNDVEPIAVGDDPARPLYSQGDILSLSSVTYPTWGTYSTRKLELSTAGDNFTIGTDKNSILITLTISGITVDDLRIITTPEPATFALFGLGLLGMGGAGFARWRRNKRKAA